MKLHPPEPDPPRLASRLTPALIPSLVLVALLPLLVPDPAPQRKKDGVIIGGGVKVGQAKVGQLKTGTIKLKSGLTYAGKNLIRFQNSQLSRQLTDRYDGPRIQIAPQKVRVLYADGSAMRVSLIRNPRFTEPVSIATSERVTDSSTSPAGDFECVTKRVQLTATSKEYLNNDYSNASARIYPGAAFKFEDFYAGNYNQIPGVRAPMTLVTDNPNVTGSSEVTVADPGSMGQVRTGIASLYGRLTGEAGNASTAYSALEAANTADLTLKVSGGASGFGVKFSGAYGMEKNERSYSLTIDARKSLYSISALPTAKGWYADDAIARGNPNMMVVGNVVYGVRILANYNVTFQSQKDALDFKASYSGVGYSAQAALEYVRTHTSTVSAVNAYVVGGPANGNIAMNKANLQYEINRAFSGVTYANARPISYQFVDRAGNIIGTKSATDEFDVRQCSPREAASPKVTSARIRFRNGNDGKDRETRASVGLFRRDGGSRLRFYQQRKSGGKYAGYADNSEVDVQLADESGGSADLKTFEQAGGGMIRVTLFRGGDRDRWRISGLTLFLGFSDGTARQIKWGTPREFPNTSSSSPPLDYYFDGSYQPIQ